MEKTTQKGEKAEALARDFLKGKNYDILHQNWRYRHAEVDIIARDGDMIVFVEVKMRSSGLFGQPEDFVDEQKMEKMQEAAEAYIEQFDWPGELRFDIIAVEKNGHITHFEDAFY